MSISKVYENAAATVADVKDGATVLIGGTARDSEPTQLLVGLIANGARNLTCVCDFGSWDGADGVFRLAAAGRIARLISPCPFVGESGGGESGGVLQTLWASGELAVDVVPQGTLAERLRAAGAGIGGVFVPAGVGTRFARDKETRVIDGVDYVFEPPLRADFALLRAYRADRVGNLVYRGPQRFWNSVMATAARVCVAEVDEIGEPGAIDPELVITPGIFVNRVVATAPVSTAPVARED